MKKFNLFIVLVILFCVGLASASEPTGTNFRSIRNRGNAPTEYVGLGGQSGKTVNVNDQGSLQVLGQTLKAFEVYTSQADAFVTDVNGNRVTGGNIYAVLVNGVSAGDNAVIWDVSISNDATGLNARPIDVQVGTAADIKVVDYGGIGVPYNNGMYITRTDTAVSVTVLYKTAE